MTTRTRMTTRGLVVMAAIAMVAAQVGVSLQAPRLLAAKGRSSAIC